MQFSVLLSVYYKEKPLYLSQSLESVFEQTLPPSELVIVKDGPLTEELDQVIDGFTNKYGKKITIVILPTNVGLGYALYEGLKHCTNEIVARMDSDDICKNDRFQQQIQVFNNHKDVSVVGSWVDEFIKEPVDIVSVRRVPETNQEIRLFAKRRNPMNHPTVMFKKKDVLSAGGYKDFPLFEDYYLWVRMLVNGYIFYNCQSSLLSFRISNDTYKRRGGLKYAINEIKLQRAFAHLGFVTTFEFFSNIVIRFFSRIMPNQFRNLLYKKVLR